MHSNNIKLNKIYFFDSVEMINTHTQAPQLEFEPRLT